LKFIGLGDFQNVRLQHRYRLTFDVATDQRRHSQIRILNSFVINLADLRYGRLFARQFSLSSVTLVHPTQEG